MRGPLCFGWSYEYMLKVRIRSRLEILWLGHALMDSQFGAVGLQ